MSEEAAAAPSIEAVSTPAEASPAAPAAVEAVAAPAPVEAAPPVVEAAPAAAAEPAVPQQPGETDANFKARVHGLTKALAEARGKIYQMQRAQREAAQAQPGAKPAAINIPDANEDPHGAINALRDLALQMASEQASESEKAAKEAAEGQYINELKGAYDASEREYVAVQPDYREAAQHYVKGRMAEMQLLGMDAPAAQRAVYNEFLRVTDYALQNGRVPAELIYGLAQQRGYAVAAPAPAPVLVPAPDPLAAIEAGQAAAKTLSAAGARTPVSDGGSPEAMIANLSGAALRSAWAKIKADRWANA